MTEKFILRIFALGIIGLSIFAAIPCLVFAETSSPPYEIPKGMPTMVDIGGDNCTPCRMMKPILKELELTYRGRAAIISINVGTDREKIRSFGARVIPTQIFYDRSGNEVSRHEGFLDKKSINDTLEKLVIQK